MSLLYGHKKRREALIAGLLTLCLALVATGYAQEQRVETLSMQVSATYHRALYEATELMDGVRLSLEKLMVSSSGERKQELLLDIARQAEGAQDDLSLLPDEHPALDGAIKFANQTADYARVLAQRMGTGGQLTREDVRQIGALHQSCGQLLFQLNELTSAYARGEFEFTIAGSDLRNTAGSPQEDEETLVSYPVLLYDGPFSDGREGAAVKVQGNPVTGEQAADILRNFIGSQRVKSVRMTGESMILSECYEFEADTESGVLEAGVTRAGGHVLYILPTRAIQGSRVSQAECMDIGRRFLEDKGFGHMSVSYWQQQDGILTVNYAYQQDGFVIYPDLIKLQISMENGLVVGIETGNYLRNHEKRTLLSPFVSEEEAMRNLNEALSVEYIRPCVIPLDNGEAQCWEITARFEGETRYLIYVDTQTGQERSILQVVYGEDGILTR